MVSELCVVSELYSPSVLQNKKHGEQSLLLNFSLRTPNSWFEPVRSIYNPETDVSAYLNSPTKLMVFDYQSPNIISYRILLWSPLLFERAMLASVMHPLGKPNQNHMRNLLPQDAFQSPNPHDLPQAKLTDFATWRGSPRLPGRDERLHKGNGVGCL